MFVDALLLVSDAQAITVTAVSTNTIDLGAGTIARRIGSGEAMGFAVQIDVAGDRTTLDETYQIDIISSADPALGTPTVLASFLLASTDLTIGKKFALPLPKGRPAQRYIGLRYTVAGTTPTITVTAALMPMSMIDAENTMYAKGYSI